MINLLNNIYTRLFSKGIVIFLSIAALLACSTNPDDEHKTSNIENDWELETTPQHHDRDFPFGTEIDFDADKHSDLLQLLFRLNWYDNEGFYIPSLKNETIHLYSISYTDFANKILKVSSEPELRRYYSAFITFDSEARVNEYSVEITPQENVESTTIPSLREIVVDYDQYQIKRTFTRESDTVYERSYDIRVFQDSEQSSTVFIQGSFGRIQAIQEVGERFELFAASLVDSEEGDQRWEFFPFGRMEFEGTNASYFLYDDWNPERIKYEFVFDSSRLTQELKYDVRSKQITFITEFYPYKVDWYDVFTLNYDTSFSERLYARQNLYRTDSLLLYRAIEYPDGAGEELFIESIE
jgi:hypothetical protein